MKRLSTLLLAAALLAPAAAHGDEACAPALTPTACRDLLVEQARQAQDAAAAQQARDAQKKIDGEPTSVDGFGSELASTMRDFLPLLDGLVGIDSISEDGKTVNLNLNPAVDYRPLQLTAKIRKPEVYEPLKLSLPEEGRDDVVGKLDSKLNDYDDLEIAATYRLTRKRSREAFRYQDVFRGLVSTVPAPNLDAFDELMQEIENRPGFPDVDDEPALAVYREHMDDAEWRRAQELLASAATAISGYQRTVATTLAGKFDAFADAVNNRSQLFASVSYRIREDLAGPDVATAKLTYEHGFSSLESLEKRLRKECGESTRSEASPFDRCGDGRGDVNWARLGNGIEEWGKAAKQNRVSLSIEYTRTDDLEVSVPDPEVDFSAEAQHSLIASVAWGRILGAHEKAPRIDLQLSYEDVGDDPDRQDRGLASLVFTQKITDKLTLPLGVLYANHARYLTGEDEKISAHFGIRYKVPDKDAAD